MRSPSVREEESKEKASCPEKRASRCKEVPTSGMQRARERIVVLKREPLDAKRNTHVREEGIKGNASCPEKRASRCKEKLTSQGGREQGKD
jgi:hypothetical protein